MRNGGDSIYFLFSIIHLNTVLLNDLSVNLITAISEFNLAVLQKHFWWT